MIKETRKYIIGVDPIVIKGKQPIGIGIRIEGHSCAYDFKGFPNFNDKVKEMACYFQSTSTNVNGAIHFGTK